MVSDKEKKLEQIVAENTGLVKSVALRLSHIYGEDAEDLIQIGYIGLIKAARRFEPERGLKFSTYAVPLITGEIKSQIRDHGAIKVSRSLKAEAAAVFLRWLTEQQRNLEFAADTGYMPVSSAAFDAIADYPFEQQSYQRLYDVYNEMRIQNTPLSEPGIVGYHAKAKTLYDSLRQRQKDYPQRLADGETLEALAEETWQLLCDNA